eukprot:gene11221-4043_t
MRSSGPGGQNVNKVNTKVLLKFHIESADWITEHIKKRLNELYPNKINMNGEFQLTSSVYRTQEQNINDAMKKLEKIIEEATIVPKVRKINLNRTKKGDAQRLKEKKLNSEKKSRRQQKYYD